MRDKITLKGVPNVKITIYYDYLGAHFEWGAYTASTGKASVTTYQYEATNVKAEHPLYETREAVFDSRLNILTIDWQLTGVPDGIDLIPITLYAQYDEQKNDVRGTVEVDFIQYPFSGVVSVWAPAKAVLWLNKSSIYTLAVDCEVLEDLTWTPVGPYAPDLQTGLSAQNAWIDLLTGDLKDGLPPAPPEPPKNWWEVIADIVTFITANWQLLAVAGVGLYLAPSALNVIGRVSGGREEEKREREREKKREKEREREREEEREEEKEEEERERRREEREIRREERRKEK